MDESETVDTRKLTELHSEIVINDEELAASMGNQLEAITKVRHSLEDFDLAIAASGDMELTKLWGFLRRLFIVKGKR